MEHQDNRQHQPKPPYDPTDALSSRPYKIALTVAAVLFLVTLTISVLLLILGRTQRQDREAEFETTLTAIYAGIQQTETALAALDRTPQAAPPLEYQQYPFVPAQDAPAYRAAESCDIQRISGSVQDQNGSATDAIHVRVWGDYLALQTIYTGEPGGQEPGQWTLTLHEPLNRRVFVQLSAAERFLSAPVEIVFSSTDCARNHAVIAFEQVAPLQ